MFVGAGWPHTAGKYGGTFTSEPMSQERGSYLRNLSQGVASMAFWFKKKKKSQLDRKGQRKYKMKRGLWIPRILSVRSKQSLFKEKEGKHRTNSHEDHS